MCAFNTPPLLLDNDRLRESMREQEQMPVRPAGRAVIIRQLAKPAATRLLSSCALPATVGAAPWPQQHWPDALRQLHWELCSSTMMRPLARMLDSPPLLPDPFAMYGGLLTPERATPELPAYHPVTGLAATLRLDLVLAGSGDVALPDGTAATLQAGDAVLLDAANAPLFPPTVAKRWLAVYYTQPTLPLAKDGHP